MDKELEELEYDTELIECAKCGTHLNGKGLWLVCDDDPDTEPELWCEGCYAKWELEPWKLG